MSAIGDRWAALQSREKTVIGILAGVVLLLIVYLLLFTGGTIMMIVTSPKLTGLALLVVPLVMLPIILFGRRVRRLSRATQDRVADVSAYAELVRAMASSVSEVISAASSFTTPPCVLNTCDQKPRIFCFHLRR